MRQIISQGLKFKKVRSTLTYHFSKFQRKLRKFDARKCSRRFWHLYLSPCSAELRALKQKLQFESRGTKKTWIQKYCSSSFKTEVGKIIFLDDTSNVHRIWKTPSKCLQFTGTPHLQLWVYCKNQRFKNIIKLNISLLIDIKYQKINIFFRGLRI